MPLIYLTILTWIVCFWKVFQKAGQPGWASIVPIYNLIITCRIAKVPGYWAVLQLIPVVGFIYIIWTWNRIVKSLGKSEGFTVGLFFLGLIFLLVLAFDKSEYNSDLLEEKK